MEMYTYKYRIYPNEEQKMFFERTFGCCRFVYNYFLNREKRFYLENKEEAETKRIKLHNTKFDNQKLLTKLKKEEQYVWLNEVSSHTLQKEIVNLDVAYNRFFKKLGSFPKFKKKGHCDSFQMDNLRLYVKNGKLFIPKVKNGIKIKEHRPLEGRIICGTISKTASDKYFVSITVEREMNKLEPSDKAVGIDLGIDSFAVLSNGEHIQNPKFKRRVISKLKFLQRQQSKKQKGSKNRNKSRKRLAKKYEKITNKKQDFLHKLSNKIVNENQVISLEDLNVKGMMKNHKLADAISEVSWYEFTRMLSYKAEWRGRTVIKVDRFFPSSKTCFKCGFIKDDLTLKDREWTCPKCGSKHNRDYNAALNILKQGLNKENLNSGWNDR